MSGYTGRYDVYVGESNNIVKRTLQHLEAAKKGGGWQKILMHKKANLYIIGHEHFNKSLTMDIENRLMLYMSSVEAVRRVYNRRGNQQNAYYTSEEFDEIFECVWKRLGKLDAVLFPSADSVKGTAVYKVSPLHKLTQEQEKIKEHVMERVRNALKGERGQIIFISGEAGTGKTVLNSNLFYELCGYQEEHQLEGLDCYLLVNHKEQLKVYKQIAEKLGLEVGGKERVCNPTHFIRTHPEQEPADVVFVDEAHLLWTQGKQAYGGSNQLYDILKRARVVIVMFDEHQVLRTDQFWEHQVIEDLVGRSKKYHNYLELKNQLRIQADAETIEWIRNFTGKQRIGKIPADSRGYEIKIFDTPLELQKAIADKASQPEFELSRLVATFDWPYIDKRPPQDGSAYWEVRIGDWSMPWNLQLKGSRKEARLAWAEQKHTIGEVGSTFTVQGFDLSYAGVILGPSVKYKNGRVIFDPECCENEKAVRNRTLSDGSKQSFGETLIRNSVNVLMTRGVNGLYIYAQDKGLREALRRKT